MQTKRPVERNLFLKLLLKVWHETRMAGSEINMTCTYKQKAGECDNFGAITLLANAKKIFAPTLGSLMYDNYILLYCYKLIKAMNKM